MKNIIVVTTLILSMLFIQSCGDKQNTESNHKYDYEHTEGDLTNTYAYTLENGLKIFMAVNKNEPRIHTNIAVRTGSKHDPSDATGLAHYLEHMLFKGTSKIATLDWEKEKVILKQISDLYEKRRTVTDKEERKAIYKEIDRLSGEAAKYAIPNEYDKMTSSLGAKATNAYTFLDQTVYVNNVPSSELEKWLKIESERFSELVLRLFHTELEAVYEEYNRGRDNDSRLSFYSMMKALFKNHTYGTQTTIGKGEHLKNPSMEKIHEYFSARYVPNNMAIIISGDIELDKTVDLIKKYFGDYKSKPLKEYTFEPENEITEVEEIEVFGPDAQWVDLAFRMPAANSKDAKILEVFDLLLANGKAGLIDLNLNQKQKVLNAYSTYLTARDYSFFSMHAVPKTGQTLEEAKELLLEQLNKIKAGDFQDWLLPAVIKDVKLQAQKSLAENNYRVGLLTDAYIHEISWSEASKKLDFFNQLTKQDIIDFANKYFKDNNYIVVYKKTGQRDAERVEKPEITKIEINRNVASAFADSVYSMPSLASKPVFLDYKKEISQSKLAESNLEFYSVKNKDTKLFDLVYFWDIDLKQNTDLNLALDYLEYLGTEELSAEELQVELFKNGLEFKVAKLDNRIALRLSGLQESLDKGIELLEKMINNLKPDKKAYQDLVARILKSRDDKKLNKSAILFEAMSSYAKYGENGPKKYVISAKDLKSKQPEQLISEIKQLANYRHSIYYYGTENLEIIVSKIEQAHKVDLAHLKETPKPEHLVELDNTNDKVYFVDYDMVQAEMLMLSKGKPFDYKLMPYISLYREYFGGGLSSIIFQEIRESKALAYSAFSFMSVPKKKDEGHYLGAYVGTQVDKLNAAVDAMKELMNNMPKVQDQFDASKKAVLKKMETTRTRRNGLFYSYLTNKDRGIDYNPQQEVYNKISSITIDDMDKFFNDYVSGKNFTYCVIGSKKHVNESILKNLGEYKELNKKTIFGF